MVADAAVRGSSFWLPGAIKKVRFNKKQYRFRAALVAPLVAPSCRSLLQYFVPLHQSLEAFFQLCLVGIGAHKNGAPSRRVSWHHHRHKFFRAYQVCGWR
jgi:hypothetical protein